MIKGKNVRYQMIRVAFSGWMCAAIVARVVQSWWRPEVSVASKVMTF